MARVLRRTSYARKGGVGGGVLFAGNFGAGKAYRHIGLFEEALRRAHTKVDRQKVGQWTLLHAL